MSTNTVNYVLTSSKPKEHVWAFGMAKRQILEHMDKYGNNFCLVIRCDYGTNHETIFVVPYFYLKDAVIHNPKVTVYSGDIIKFEIAKSDFHFNWHPKIQMDGTKFLCTGD
jgi:hypothetical protein